MYRDVLVAEVVPDSRKGKRKLANAEACKAELKKELVMLFQTFEQATKKTTKNLLNFPPQARSRAFEAGMIQSTFAEFLFNNFGDSKARWGKHKRLVLSLDGYLILFKKFDSSSRPMNSKTASVQALLNQNQTLDLFVESGISEDPILYFGYKKNKLGEYISPQIVYIDEGKVQFIITESEIEQNIKKVQFQNVPESAPIGMMPKLRVKRKAQ